MPAEVEGNVKDWPLSTAYLTEESERPPNYHKAISSGQIFSSPTTIISYAKAQRGRSVRPLGSLVLNPSLFKSPMYVRRTTAVSPEIEIKQPNKAIPYINRRCFKISAFLGVLLTIVFLIFLAIYGLSPCSLTRCHSKASICINSPFYARCICDIGYQGNGKQYCDECGLTSIEPNVRIVGGKYSTEHSWPYSVVIVIKYTTIKKLYGDNLKIKISFLCGGTLINRKTILTAAHCNVESFDYEHEGKIYEIPVELNSFYPTRESMFHVYVGVHNRSDMNSLPAKSYSVSKLIKHEEYDDVNIVNDLAILKLNEEVELNEYAQIACLPLARVGQLTYPSTSPNRSAWIVGWGTTSQYGTSSQTLKNARVTVYDESLCKNVLPRNSKNWNAQICAGDLQGHIDTCQGDSGGSLYINDFIMNKTRFITAGIVSYGEGCAKVNHPGIYTRTSYYLDWINRHTDF